MMDLRAGNKGELLSRSSSSSSLSPLSSLDGSSIQIEREMREKTNMSINDVLYSTEPVDLVLSSGADLRVEFFAFSE